MNATKIEWTDLTWNPVRARNTRHDARFPDEPSRTGTFCTRISPGCKNCYASTINRRFGTGDEYEVPNLAHHEFFISEKILEEPLKRKKPARIFVGDMFDLFHEQIDVTFVGRVFGMMAKCPQHTFQVLTKRADYMMQLLTRAQLYNDEYISLPLPNVWLGVSVEDNKRALERIPKLQETPAAVRFLSVEPQLEHIDLGHDTPELGWISYLRGFDGCDPVGESGPGARPFNLAWAESILEQCRASSVPCFIKQMGSHAKTDSPFYFKGQRGRLYFKDRKGGDPAEWPEHLRVREFPSQKAEAVIA